MTVALSLDDFPVFFEELLGVPPFPWQKRLMAQVVQSGWPAVLGLPTGSGKTATLVIALFHLAIQADWGSRRNAAVRMVLAVDRRLIVDDAFALAQTLERGLAHPDGPIAARVAQRLAALSLEGRPVIARRLRGGLPREDDWARTPAQPTILCSTVDQIGSRLLFRGYGISDRAKPIHAGLLGSDCHILLDEAHLSEPFRQTLEWIRHYQSPQWVERPETSGPWGVTLLSATPPANLVPAFELGPEDYADPVLGARWRATKPTRLVLIDDATRDPEQARAERLIRETEAGLQALREQGLQQPAMGVVVNRIARARAVFERLRDDLADACEVLLLIGPARAVDREPVTEALRRLHTGIAARASDGRLPVVVVATQCLEAGVDIDLDGLVTDIAPLDALRQRFGRVNRAGRRLRPWGAIVATRTEVAPGFTDPVYGTTLPACWEYLTRLADADPLRAPSDPTVDFGLAAFATTMASVVPPPSTMTDRPDAPVLVPAHLDLLAQTSPRPRPDPDVALYLHGPDRQPASVSVVWRGDVFPAMPATAVRQLLALVPPRTGEAISLPIWAVIDWLQTQGKGAQVQADVAEIEPVRVPTDNQDDHAVFRWTGDDEGSRWVRPTSIRPGDVIVVPAERGGVDGFGWNPPDPGPAADVADAASEPFAGRYLAVRVAPGLIPKSTEAALAAVLAASPRWGWRDLREALRALDLGDRIQGRLDRLDHARRNRVTLFFDPYTPRGSQPPCGVVLVAPFGVSDGATAESGPTPSTEDDANGSLQGVAVTLERHARDVARRTQQFAEAAGLPPWLVQDVTLAGSLHDAGKVDPRFQALLAYGDPLGPDPDQVLAKSALYRGVASGERVGLPSHWRHEALSVMIAIRHTSLKTATDPELVLWLVGSHHGWGRPFFPHIDPLDRDPDRELPPVLGEQITLGAVPGPHSLEFEFGGTDWAGLYQRLRVRYGTWGLARLEAILRLGDHRASEEERLNPGEEVQTHDRTEPIPSP